MKEIFSKLLKLAPDLLPLLIATIFDIEKTISGIGKGAIKKAAVLDAITNILKAKDYFTNSGADVQGQILNLVEQAIDFIVMAFNFLGIFSTTQKVDFTPVPPVDPPPDTPPATNESGYSRLGVVITTLLFGAMMSLFLIGGCSKPLTPASEVVYEGPMNPSPAEWSFQSSAEMTEMCLKAKECMGLEELTAPLPAVRGVTGGTGVQCGDRITVACYHDGTITIPDGAELDVVAHECVHHWLWVSTGDSDPEHESLYFLKCGGGLTAD